MVEDNPADVLLAKETLEGSVIVSNLHAVSDGMEAMEFLRRENKHREAPRPGLILLDLNIPLKDGWELLSEIKNDDRLKRIPVVVLAASKIEADIQRAYGLHANCYIVKPVDFAKYAAVLRTIEHFWFAVARLPMRV
ncbi:response regulator [Zavarzinella formosa]|uniref:response regulator n=1 Tax=Zavarzinella formosa TaxID=360055 RepID=UPI001EE661C2|nr:response regulator [Zavarzinella formosa]